jgi:thiosulfate/3-mercaptopyruvate sulfurtransferase
MKTATATAATGPGQQAGPEVLVHRQWLQDHQFDPDVRIVEADVSAAAYNEWHIDGAVLWNVYADLKDPEYRPVGAADLDELIARSGIGPDSTVVCYGYAPALAFWILKLRGLRDVRILDCSRNTWRAEGRPWSTTATAAAPAGLAPGGADEGIRARLEAVQTAIGQPGTTLVDVRSQAEFAGERFWPSGGMEPGGRAGHIPSAVHQPIDGLYNDDGSFRPAAELRQVFAVLDLDGDDELITYCTIGGRAATAWFVLTELLGLDRVRVYDGSWAEWGRTAGTPVEQ